MNKKDILLNTMVSNPNPESYFTYESLQEYVFNELNIDEVKYIIESIIKEKPGLIKEHFSLNRKVGYKPTGLVKDFLNNGGFTKIELAEEDKQKKTEIREAKSDKLLDLDLRLRSFESKIEKKLIVVGFIITLLSFLITVLTLEFWQTDDEKLQQTPKVETKQLNKIESKLKNSGFHNI